MRLTKRAFMKALAASGLGTIPGRLFGQATNGSSGRGKQFNWAANLQYGTDQLAETRSAQQVLDSVKEHSHLKALGSRHCFNTIADSAQQLVSLKEMAKPLELNTETRTVTVEGGMSYGQLGPWLDERGFALHNLASLPHVTVAGACATATHGSGDSNGNLATAVAGLEIAGADGELHSLSRRQDGNNFLGAPVHLGALGIVTKITLDVEPTFKAREYSYRGLTLQAACDNLAAIFSTGYSVSIFTRWNGLGSIRVKVRDDSGFSPAPELFGAKLAANDAKSTPGPWYDRLPHFRMDSLPPRGNELQSEYFVGIENSVDAIQAVARFGDQIAPHLKATELRTVAADDLWMSTCYKRASLAIHFTWEPHESAVRNLLPKIEGALAAYQPRPHWGKLFAMSPALVQSRYERLDDFKELVNRFDPNGKFRNDFLQKTLYG